MQVRTTDQRKNLREAGSRAKLASFALAIRVSLLPTLITIAAILEKGTIWAL